MNNGNVRAASDSRRTPTYFKERSFPNRLRTSKPTKKKKKTHAMSWLSYKTTIRSREYHSRLVWSNIATGQDYSKNMLKWAKATLQPWWWWRVVQFHFHYVCSGWTLRFLTGLNSMKTSEAFRDSLRLSLRRRGVIDVWNGEKTGMRCIPTHTHTHVELQKSCTHT